MGSVSFDFEDQVVIVTGGSAGIGRAIATRFGAAGATVINADLRATPRAKEATPTHELIEERGGQAEFVKTDCGDPDAIRALVGVAEEVGGLDVMVNNAGVYSDKPFEAVTPAELERVFRVNINGVYLGTQAAAEAMADGGVIVNTASISSTCAQPNQSVYNTSKAAVTMITKTAALEFADDDIRVNAIAPGKIATAFGPSGPAETEAAVKEGSTIKPIPLGRAGYPADIEGTALFLASEAAAYITGECVHVDGGYQII